MLYVILYNYYDDTSIYGVFDDKDNAKNLIKNVLECSGKFGSFSIVEVPLNKLNINYKGYQSND
jgi:hypothetical protein